jgi:hypothetical protein
MTPKTSKPSKAKKRAVPAPVVPERIQAFTRLTPRNVATSDDFETRKMGIASKE